MEHPVYIIVTFILIIIIIIIYFIIVYTNALFLVWINDEIIREKEKALEIFPSNNFFITDEKTSRRRFV